MKMHTTPEQTTKLIELGFKKPKSIRYPKNEMEAERVNTTDFLISDYSIGELLSVLPKSIKVNDCYFTLTISAEFDNWLVEYVDITYGSQAYVRDVELIDALFTEIVMLKEEGVI